MTRFAILLSLLMLPGLASPLCAQPPPQQPPAPPPATAGEPGGARAHTLDYVLAFSGVALVMVVVCYPSRRY